MYKTPPTCIDCKRFISKEQAKVNINRCEFCEAQYTDFMQDVAQESFDEFVTTHEQDEYNECQDECR